MNSSQLSITEIELDLLEDLTMEAEHSSDVSHGVDDFMISKEKFTPLYESH